MRDIQADDALHRTHGLLNRADTAGSEIDGDTLAAAEQTSNGCYVRTCEIADVYATTYGRFIGRPPMGQRAIVLLTCNR